MTAQTRVFGWLRQLCAEQASDLFLTHGFPPAMKLDGHIVPLSQQPLSAEECIHMAAALMTAEQAHTFASTHECNFSLQVPEAGRFRVNAFRQRGATGMVLRAINSTIPTLDSLDLPPILKEVALTQRGLVIFVGGTGSGKSTSLAAMLGHRNHHSRGHIITIEDPIEFVHEHGNCIVTQREIGVDTDDWISALKNTLRQAPDVIMIGEIRDRETMDYAIAFAETGHLCLATLHANNTNQALDRIVNFFPEERRGQLLMDIALNMRAFVSQRLIGRNNGQGRIAATEIMLNSPLISDLIFKGEVTQIKEVMRRSRELGMQTFDQSLFALHEAGHISYEDALRYADSVNDLRLKIKLEGHATGNTDTHATKHLRIL